MLLKYENIKTFLQKSMFQIVLKVFFITKVKNTVPCIYAISDLKGEEIAGRFYEKGL